MTKISKCGYGPVMTVTEILMAGLSGLRFVAIVALAAALLLFLLMLTGDRRR